VLVAAGPRATAAAYDELYRGGAGWLPARLVAVAGENGPAVQPEPPTFAHPALELFRRQPNGTLGQARLKRWWKVATDARHGGTPVALLSNGDPLLVEKKAGNGRALLCTVPLDRGWDSPLPATWEFPVLLHELVYYLAGATAGDHVLADGRPLRIDRPGGGAATLFLQTPEAQQTIAVTDWPWSYADTGAIGVYATRVGDEPPRYHIVRPDPGETDPRRCTDDDWRKVVAALPPGLLASEGVDAGADGAHRRHELWWLVLLGVVALLCVEVAVTRRAVLARRR
jgi:hypothetical protein